MQKIKVKGFTIEFGWEWYPTSVDEIEVFECWIGNEDYADPCGYGPDLERIMDLIYPELDTCDDQYDVECDWLRSVLK